MLLASNILVTLSLSFFFFLEMVAGSLKRRPTGSEDGINTSLPPRTGVLHPIPEAIELCVMHTFLEYDKANPLRPAMLTPESN